MDARLRTLGFQARYVGRDAAASPAVGSHLLHEEEQQAIVAEALNGNVLQAASKE